ncbi:MAG TPA: sugar ABC transporter substrate-binding protein [Clostridiaceae bacterium]|nr:sugar ABC transporter substrate-binding protein [Clostridiaceae bacterium]
MSSLMRKVKIIIVAVILAIISAACEPTEQSREPDDESKTVIGFSMATLKEDRWLQDRDIFIAKAKQEGFEVIVKNANNDSKLQIEQVNDMIASGIDVLVIVPHDSEEAAACVSAAKKAGIPVVSYDRLVRNANVDVYVSFDNVKVGIVAAESLVKAVPQGEYIILNGAENDNNCKMFNEGFMTVLNRPENKDKIKVVAETWVEDWRRELAFEFVSEVLKEKGESIKGIIAGNDSLAWGAIDAISVARLTGKIKVVGHDADLAACQRIVEGTQVSTVYKPIKKLVEETLNCCKILLEGKKISDQNVINDGTYDIPYVMIDVILVNRDNIDETVIKDGFHLKEDVYRGLKDQGGY